MHLALRRVLWVGVVGLAALVVPAVAQAQTTPTQYTFTTVDAVEMSGSILFVTGIQSGDSAPTTVKVSFAYSSDIGANQGFAAACERKALLAMTKPGQYLFSFKPGPWPWPTCALSRVQP